MGTNYYLHQEKPCYACGHVKEPLHIGKSSYGWHFSLHVIPEEGINSLEDWIGLWSRPAALIQDEYGVNISSEEMLTKIIKRAGGDRDIGDFPFAQNQAEAGLNNLVRHKIDGRHCIGNGDGTYDFIAGEFC